MAKEPLIYTRSLIDKLQKDISRFVFGIGIVSFVATLLYYVYSIYLQVVLERYITLGVYSAIALVSIAVFGLYVSQRGLEELEKRYSREHLRAFFSWVIIALRGVALGFSLYQVYAIGVSDFDKVVTIGMLIWLVLQAFIECFKAFLFHYIDLFKLGFEEDKKTLGDDVKDVVTDYVKDAIASKFKWGANKVADTVVGYKEEETSERMGPYEQKLRKELEEAHADYSAKRTLEKATKEKKEEAEETERNEKRNAHFRNLFNFKRKSTSEKGKNLVPLDDENKVQ